MQYRNLNLHLLGILLLVSGIINAQNHTWFGNNHFQINEKNGLTSIEVNKKPWEAFTLYINELDLSRSPFLSFEIKTDQAIELRVDMVDVSNNNLTQSPILKTVIPLNNFIILEYDFSDFIHLIDATRVTHFQFFVQPNLEFQGNLEIKDIKIGNDKDLPISNNSEISILINTKNKEVIIQSKQKEFDEIKIYNALGILTYHQNFTHTFLEKIDLQIFASGVYFLEVIANNKSIQAGTFIR